MFQRTPAVEALCRDLLAYPVDPEEIGRRMALLNAPAISHIAHFVGSAGEQYLHAFLESEAVRLPDMALLTEKTRRGSRSRIERRPTGSYAGVEKEGEDTFEVDAIATIGGVPVMIDLSVGISCRRSNTYRNNHDSGKNPGRMDVRENEARASFRQKLHIGEDVFGAKPAYVVAVCADEISRARASPYGRKLRDYNGLLVPLGFTRSEFREHVEPLYMQRTGREPQAA